jgi:tetratricopeptide (TPR) repeat protein
MHRYVIFIALIAGAPAGVSLAARGIAPDEKALENRALALNDITGDEPIRGQIRTLVADPEGTKKLFAAAVALAKQKDQPFNFNAAYILARAAVELKDYTAGETFYRVCLDQAAKLKSAAKLVAGLRGLSTIIDLLYLEKKYDETAKLCQDFLEILEKEQITQEVKEDVLRQWIRALIKQGKADDASKMIDNLVKARADNWRNQELRAWFHQENNRPDEAAKAYEEALTLIAKDQSIQKPKRDEFIAETHLILSRLYHKLDQAEKVQVHMLGAIKASEDFIAANEEKNLEGLEKLERDFVRYRLSGLYMETKKLDKAINLLKTLVDENPNNPTYNNDLGYIWADNDMNMEEAEKLIRKALEEDRKLRRERKPDLKPEEDKDNSSYLDSLGWVLFKKKNYSEAKKYLLRAVEEKDGQNVEIYDHLGDVHMALGEKQEAVAAYKKAIEAATDTPREKERKQIVAQKLKGLE